MANLKVSAATMRLTAIFNLARSWAIRLKSDKFQEPPPGSMQRVHRYFPPINAYFSIALFHLNPLKMH